MIHQPVGLIVFRGLENFLFGKPFSVKMLSLWASTDTMCVSVWRHIALAGLSVCLGGNNSWFIYIQCCWHVTFTWIPGTWIGFKLVGWVVQRLLLCVWSRAISTELCSATFAKYRSTLQVVSPATNFWHTLFLSFMWLRSRPPLSSVYPQTNMPQTRYSLNTYVLCCLIISGKFICCPTFCKYTHTHIHAHICTCISTVSLKPCVQFCWPSSLLQRPTFVCFFSIC